LRDSRHTGAEVSYSGAAEAGSKRMIGKEKSKYSALPIGR
jgi:hypothetical protein